ncbi:MAG: hypothetical protein V4532_03515 [Pseudomonadota bacterium]
MLIGLAVALALTAWVALQGDDTAVEPVRRDEGSGRRSEAKTTKTPAPSRRASSSSMAAKDPKADGATAQALVQSVMQWQQRASLSPWPDGAVNHPWASQLPPAPPPTVLVAAPPPPPMAPPFPHAWVGRFNDEAHRAIVSSADATWVVAEGDVIESQWRIDQIQERQMTLTYLPLQQRQTIAMKAP